MKKNGTKQKKTAKKVSCLTTLTPFKTERVSFQQAPSDLPPLSQYPVIEQRMAIHEAAHAVVAWRLGRDVHSIEISESYTARADHGIFGGEGPSGRTIRECWIPEESFYAEDTLVIEECAICYAGCVAEAQHTHQSLVYCLQATGKGDQGRIIEFLIQGVMDTSSWELGQARRLAGKLVAKNMAIIRSVAEVLLKERSLSAGVFYSIVRANIAKHLTEAFAGA